MKEILKEGWDVYPKWLWAGNMVLRNSNGIISYTICMILDSWIFYLIILGIWRI